MGTTTRAEINEHVQRFGVPSVPTLEDDPTTEATISDADDENPNHKLGVVTDWLIEEQDIRSHTERRDAWNGCFWELAQDADQEEDNSGLNRLGETYGSVHQAVFWEDLQGLILLTNRGADINMGTQQFCRKSELAKGSTPLHLAAA